MNDKSAQYSLIDIKDLIYVILRKIIIVIIASVIGAALFSGYKLFSSLKANNIDNSTDATILDVTNRLPEETDIEFNDRVSLVNRAKDIVNSIGSLKNQISNQRKYVSNSVFMQIDSENEAVTTANLMVYVNDSQSTEIEMALSSTYKQYVLSGEYLTPLSDEMNISQGYLIELIKADYESSSVINYSTDSGKAGLITISVIGPSTELTNKIMDSILESIDIKCDELNKSVVKHSVNILSRQSSYVVDSTTRDRQYNAANRFENIQQQINSFDKALESIATKLEVEKTSIYLYFSDYDQDIIVNSSISYGSILKYSIVGFIFGALIVFSIISIDYIFNSKFSTQMKFFHHFNWINRIGVVKPNIIRSRYNTFIDYLSGDDSKYSVKSINRLISSNVKVLSKGMNRILFTGTIDAELINQLVKDLNINVDVMNSIFDDPECLESIVNYDGVIIVEKRNNSNIKTIEEEIRLLTNSDVKIIGAIIL